MMQSVNRFPVVFLALAGVALVASPVFAEAPAGAPETQGEGTLKSPSEVVKTAAREIIHALDANTEKLKKNPQFVQQLVKKHLLPYFDFEMTSRLVLGRYWRMATPAQRKAFQKAFLHYLTATYAKALRHYQGVKVDVFPFRGDTSDRYVKVRSQLVVPGHAPISVNYALVKRDTGWKLFDFIIEGVSYVRTYQTQFRSEIRHTSLEALINRLQNAKAPSSMTAIKAGAPSTASGA